MNKPMFFNPMIVFPTIVGTLVFGLLYGLGLLLEGKLVRYATEVSLVGPKSQLSYEIDRLQFEIIRSISQEASENGWFGPELIEIIPKMDERVAELLQETFMAESFVDQLTQASDIKQDLLNEVPTAKTVPQIFIEDVYIGGYTELMKYFTSQQK